MLPESKIASLFVLSVILTGMVAGPCTAFWQPDRQVKFDNSIQWLSDYDRESNTQSIAVEMEFRGDAENFGITFATPSEPNVYETNDSLFDQLDQITPRKPKTLDLDLGFGGTVESLSESVSGVEVVEQKDVGDFKASVLKANSTKSLTEWLSRNNYSYDQDNVKAFRYYVEKDDFHFIALKINSDKVQCLQDWERLNKNALANGRMNPDISRKEAAILLDGRSEGEVDNRFASFSNLRDRFPNLNTSEYDTDRCYVRGKLKPFAVDYKVEEPTLYTRIMGQNAKRPMEIELYSTGDVPYYVPGSKVKYSQRVDAKDLKEAPAAREFVNKGEWITRSTLRMDFNKVTRDIKLRQGTSKLSISRGEDPKTVNAQIKKNGTGIITPEKVENLKIRQEGGLGYYTKSEIFSLKQTIVSTLEKSLKSVAGAILGLLISPLVPFVFILLLLKAPSAVLILLLPLFFGLLWNTRDALKAGFLTGVFVGITAALIGLADGLLVFKNGMMYVSASIIAASINLGILSSLSSKFTSYSKRIESFRGKVTPNFRKSIGPVLASSVISVASIQALELMDTEAVLFFGVPIIGFLLLSLTGIFALGRLSNKRLFFN